MAVLVELVSVTLSPIEKYYDVLLIEKNGNRALSIPIGEHEGENLGLAIDKVALPRPLTFDLFCEILSKTNIKMQYVVLNKFYDGTFYSNICCEQNQKTLCFDSRCSDAFIFAKKLSLPIYVEEKVFENAGFEILSPTEISSPTYNEEDWTIEELETILKEVEKEGDESIVNMLREKIKDLEKNN
ncbi:MAG: bifunctional nuclease family protein [Bacteroidales bacterium]|jgi:bifunctional DNase/RNase|nr:bifunctional nuclease family protein [Bacteroidales bacterium]